MNSEYLACCWYHMIKSSYVEQALNESMFSLLLSKYAFVLFLLLQYLNRGCTRYFANKETDKQILQNRKSPEVCLSLQLVYIIK